MSDIEQDIVLLDTVAYKYFGVQPSVARRKAALNTLPIPAFRLTGTRHGPLYVRRSDIDSHIKKVYEKAADVNAKMLSVTTTL